MRTTTKQNSNGMQKHSVRADRKDSVSAFHSPKGVEEGGGRKKSIGRRHCILLEPAALQSKEICESMVGHQSRVGQWALGIRSLRSFPFF